MANPQLQDAVFDHQFGQYVQKYGPEGAAQAWLGGPGGVGKTGRRDSLGTSIGEYGKRFIAAGGGAQVASLDPSAGMSAADAIETVAPRAPAPGGYRDPMVSAPNAYRGSDYNSPMVTYDDRGMRVERPSQQTPAPVQPPVQQPAPTQVAQNGQFPTAPQPPAPPQAPTNPYQGVDPEMLKLLNNPFLDADKKQIIQGIVQQQMQRNDPAYQLDIQTKQAQLEALRAKPGDPWEKLDDGTLFRKSTGEIKQVGPASAGGDGQFRFKGNSVEAQALNGLMESGQLTPAQAQQLGAGKTITGPNGEIIFMTPQGVFGQNADGSTSRISGPQAPQEGAILGGLQGAGSGEGFEDRFYKSGVGTGTGFALGAALPSVATAVSGAFKGATAPLVAPFRPAAYTDKAMRTYLKRSGKTPDEIASIMQLAADDGQAMYTMADAMGNAGQRALVPVTRTPNDARQEVTDFLLRRQMGQPQRLANALAEGFDAPQTSERVSRSLTEARGVEANKLYGAARKEAGAVNVTPILDRIDETLSPGVNKMLSPRDSIGNDTIEGALSRVRKMISDGNSQVTDFNTLFRAKLDLDDMITRAEAQGAGNRAHYLSQVKREVDRALENASPAYRTANDTFRTRSQVIDAIDAGKAAKSGRVRAEDSIDQFRGMTPDQQQAFRSGYVDPIIADVESAAMGPATNRARTLTTPKYEQEFQEFAAPGRAQQLGARIGRENRMFETNNAALGNSRTADNLGDIDDMANFDPAVLSNLLSGNFTQAALAGVRQAFNAGKGMPPRVVERVGRQLIETNPEAAREALSRVSSQQVSRDRLRAMILGSMLQNSNAGVARVK